MRATPCTPIGSVTGDGIVKIAGVVSFVGEPLRAPVSGWPSTWYDTLVVLDEHHLVEGGGYRADVFQDSARRDFVLSDGTGTAIIRIAHSNVSVAAGMRETDGVLDEPTDAIRDLLASNGVFDPPGRFIRRYRYREQIVTAGDRVIVAGQAHWEPDPDAAGEHGYRAHGTRLVIVAPGSDAPVLLCCEIDPEPPVRVP